MNESVHSIANNLGAITSLLFGLWALMRPRRVAAALWFELRGSRGRAEFRINFGGLLIGISAFVLWAQQPVIFNALGFLWLGGAAARLLVWFADQPTLDRTYLGFFLFELAHAGLLIW